MVKKDLDYTPIINLGFTMKTINKLEKAGIKYLCQLQESTKEELIEKDGFGKKTIAEVNDYLLKK